MAARDCDFLIIGAGIAGASAGYFLGRHGSVALLERESAPGYHTTGRSAAFYAPSYGGPSIRPLTIASGPFLRRPPEGFSETPLVTVPSTWLTPARPSSEPAISITIV